MNIDSNESRIINERIAGQENRNQERGTGADPNGGASSLRGIPYPGEVTRHQHYVAGFKYMMQRVKALRESISPPLCKSSSSDSGQSTPASPTRATIQDRRRLPALPATKPWCRSPPDSTATSEHEPGLDTGESLSTSPAPLSKRKTNPADTQPGVPKGVRNHTTSVYIEVERATADHQTKQPTSREWGEVAAQLTSVANNAARMFESYLASLDDTLKELKPCLAKVNRTSHIDQCHIFLPLTL